MNRSKRVAVLSVGIFLAWVGLCQLGPQVPLAAERPTPVTGSREGRQTRTSPPAGSVELRCRVEQPTMILSLVPPGQSVKKGDLLVELDVSALVDKRIQQVFQTRKTETDWIVARESQSFEKHTATGQIDLAAKALRLAQNQLKAFTEGEYPNQLAMAEAVGQIAKEKRTMNEDRVARLRATIRPDETAGTAAMTALQEAQMALQEASVQSHAAENALTMLKTFGRDNKVAELELAVAQREFDLARAKDALSAANARSGALLQLAEITHQMEADRLAKLDDQIVKGKIYAPQDGIVVYPDDAGEAALRPGAVVHPGQVLVRLVPATSMPVKP